VITSDQLASSDGSCFKLLTLASILLCRLPGRTNHLCAKCRGKAYLLSQQTVREIVDAVLKGNKPQVSSGRKRFDSLAPRTPFRSTFMAWPQRSLRLLARPCLTSQCVRPLTQTTRLRPAAWCASPTPFMQQRRTCTRSSMQLADSPSTENTCHTHTSSSYGAATFGMSAAGNGSASRSAAHVPSFVTGE
jgi:hypothetical protein